MVINVRKIHPDARLPYRAHPTDAGADLCCVSPVEMYPGERRIVPTGIVVEIPEGYEGQIRPRSGLASKEGVTVLNAPGTIDAGYRGEVCVILIHHGSQPLALPAGSRIAQLVIAPIITPAFLTVEKVGASLRGAAGFGSTGIAIVDDEPYRYGRLVRMEATCRPN